MARRHRSRIFTTLFFVSWGTCLTECTRGSVHMCPWSTGTWTLFSPTVLVPSSELTSGSKREDRATSEDPRKVAKNASGESLAMPRRA